jgi:hypothetical protein
MARQLLHIQVGVKLLLAAARLLFFLGRQLCWHAWTRIASPVSATGLVFASRLRRCLPAFIAVVHGGRILAGSA